MTKKLNNEFKKSFLKVFSESLEICSKTKAKFEVKKNVTPVSKPKRRVPFAELEQINKEFDNLEKLEVISRIDISEWASPTEILKSAYVLIFQRG